MSMRDIIIYKYAIQFGSITLKIAFALQNSLIIKLSLIVSKLYDENYPNSYFFSFINSQGSNEYTKFVGNSNGMFIIESISNNYGGKVQWGQQYRLKHLTQINLQYFTDYQARAHIWQSEVHLPGNQKLIKQFSIKIFRFDQLELEAMRKLELVASIADASLFRFEFIFSTLSSKKNIPDLDIYILKDSYFRLVWEAQDNCYNKFQCISILEKYFLTFKVVSSEQLLLKDSHINQLRVQYIIPIMTTMQKEESIFKLARASQQELKIAQFIISSLNILSNSFQCIKPEFIIQEDFKLSNKYRHFLIKMQNLENCLTDLSLFCQNKLRAYLFAHQIYGITNTYIQNVLREQLFIEMLVKLVLSAFPKVEYLDEYNEVIQKLESMQKNQETQTKQPGPEALKEEFLIMKKRICTLAYILLSKLIENNNQNKLRVANFLPIFAMQSQSFPAAFELIKKLITDYEELLYKLHKETKGDLVIAQEKDHDERGEMVVAGKNSQWQKEKEYIRFYNSILDKTIRDQDEYSLKDTWNLLQFYVYMLFRPTTTQEQKIEAINILKTSTLLFQFGLNVNQELIFKYLLIEENKTVFEKNIFWQIETNENAIDVKLEDYVVHLEDLVMHPKQFLWEKQTSMKRKKPILQTEMSQNKQQLLEIVLNQGIVKLRLFIIFQDQRKY